MNHRPSAFTLIEMLTVISVIAILTSLIVAVSGLVQRNAAVKRAEGEIAGMSAACEQYKNDNGEVPNSKKTELLDPRVDGNPASGDTREKYQDACLLLYSSLTGDFLPDNHPDFRPEDGKKSYYEFKPNNLNYKKTAEQQIQEINYIQDPWGNCYGYSTIRAKFEREFQKKLRADPHASRAADMPGYNPIFDMWSTGGATRSRPKDGEQEDVKKWVKNW
jgi:prepilin-type N-terminal cleavage/methylation domain-containing protein